MARRYLMSWNARHRRWMKEYKGKKYAVSCRQLGVPETKEASYQAANGWWERKKAEIDAGRQIVRLPLEDVGLANIGLRPEKVTDFQSFLDALPVRVVYPAGGGGEYILITGTQEPSPEEVAEIIKRRRSVEAVPPPDGPPAEVPLDPHTKLIMVNPPAWGDVATELQRLVVQEIGKAIVSGQHLPDGIAENLPPARVQQLETGLKGLRGEPTVPVERTVGGQVEGWVRGYQVQVASGQLAPDRADNIRIAIEHFKNFVGSDADVATIDSQLTDPLQRLFHMRFCEVEIGYAPFSRGPGERSPGLSSSMAC
jgi:hypothetical protein